MDAEYHTFIFDAIREERSICARVELAKVLGSQVIAPLIKSKKYRKDLTDYINTLRLSKCFRDRQMYIYIAQAAFEKD